jgi:hypothetical protein
MTVRVCMALKLPFALEAEKDQAQEPVTGIKDRD